MQTQQLIVDKLWNEEARRYADTDAEMADLLKTQYETVFSSPMRTTVYTEHAAEAQSWLEDIDFTEEDIAEAIEFWEEKSNRSARHGEDY